MNDKLAIAAPAFSISGQVKVPLAELDKLRADYAATLQHAANLEEHQMQVKVLLVEKKSVYEASNSRYNVGKWADAFIQIGQEYKNLDDVRAVIHKEEEEKIFKEKTDIRNTLRLREEKLSHMSVDLAATTRERDTLASNIKLAEAQVATHEQQLKDYLDKINELIETRASIRMQMVQYSDLLDAERQKKSFWFWLSCQFRMKP